jgi:Dual-action HEIGH metallo-peptidase
MGDVMMLKNACLVVAMALVGCSAGEDGDNELLTREDAIDEIVENLIAADYPESEIEVRDDGIVVVGGDAVVSLEASREMIGLTSDGHEHGDQFRQYRTTNLVGAGIAVICINGSAATGAMSTALDNAIATYNALNLQFDFLRTNGPGGAGCNATITMSVKGGAGGVSGFPSGGMPYASFQVGKSTANYGIPVAQHVIEHELGHCIGFRHSDYYNRAISCGSGGNEGDGGVGAILIPGTPNVAVMDGSVFNSCFHGGSTGVFTASDVTALNALY